MNIRHVGEGTVVLIAGGGKVYTDVAARFTRSERSLAEILASPYNEKLDAVDMTKISIFLVNEVEGGQITGATDPQEILKIMLEKFPHARIVLTLGKDGAVYADANETHFQPIFPVQAVDTTAAGDTFTGYFLAGISEGMSIPDTLRMSAKASSIAVTRPGAVPSIPLRQEVMEALQAD